MTKHTPAPWRYEQYKDFTDREGGQIGISANTWGNLCIVYQHCCKDPQEGMANARLIAAAPDLLEACKRVKSIFDAMFGDCVDDKEGNLEFIKQAIAKAEGN